MESIYRIIHHTYLRISRHAFQTNPRGHSMFQDLDDLIGQKDCFIGYIKCEYSLAIFYNVFVAFPALVYYFSRFHIIFSCDLISSIWFFFVCLIKIIEIAPKSILIYQTVRISNNSNDAIICSRRLMYMTRSNIFFYNTILGYVLLVSYTFYFLCIRRSSVCERAPQFYYIINWLVLGFFLRLMISFVNYFLHFKFTTEDNGNSSDIYEDFSNRVTVEVMNMIECVILTKQNINELIPLTDENERDVCCICMLAFQEGEMIKLMPCNRKHIFHKCCIDKWLSHNKACPNCRKEINRKLFQKTRIY